MLALQTMFSMQKTKRALHINATRQNGSGSPGDYISTECSNHVLTFIVRLCDHRSNVFGEGDPVLWVDEVDEGTADPHVLRVAEDLG